MQRIKRRIKEQLLTVMDLLDAKLGAAVDLGSGAIGPESSAAIREMCEAQAALVDALKETRTVRDQSIDGLPDDADERDEAALQAKLHRTGPEGEALVFWPMTQCFCPSCGSPDFAVCGSIKPAQMRPAPDLPDYALGILACKCRECDHEATIANAAEVQLREEMGMRELPTG